VVADEQRAEFLAAAARLGPSADHELLTPLDLDLHPLARTDRAVRRRAHLADDPFQTALLRQVKELLAVGEDVLRVQHAAIGHDQLLHQAFPLFERVLPLIPAVRVEQVEDDVRDRRRLRAFAPFQLGLLARLQRLKIRLAARVEHAQLAVDDHRDRLERARERGHLPKLVQQVFARARGERDLVFLDRRDRAIAVPLQLEQPAVVVERLVDERGEHRLHVARDRIGLHGSRTRRALHERSVGRSRAIAVPDRRVLALRVLIAQRAPGLDALRVVLHPPRRIFELVVVFEEQPRLAVLAFARLDRDERRALRDRPRRHRAAGLEPEAPVQPRRAMLLHDEAELLGRSPLSSFGFRGRREVALANVLRERIALRQLDPFLVAERRVAHVARGLVHVALQVVSRFAHVRGDALAERHAVTLDGAVELLGSGLHAFFRLVERVVRVRLQRLDRVARRRVIVAAIHQCVPPPLEEPPVVVVVPEPDVPPPVVPPLSGCELVVFVVLRVVLVWFHGCHTKSAISATTTITATRLKVARDPPLSRSIVTLRSSIRLLPPVVAVFSTRKREELNRAAESREPA